MNSEHYDFNDLVKKLALKLQSGVDIDIYTTEGEVDRKYICEINKNENSDIVCFDSLFTDGIATRVAEGLEVNNSTYVGIVSISRDAKTNDFVSEKVSVFFTLPAFGYFQAYLLSKECMSLFAQVVNKNTVKGKIENYVAQENGTIIRPCLKNKEYDIVSRTVLESGVSRVRK